MTDKEFKPLEPVPSPSSSEQLRVWCVRCRAHLPYGEAQRAGWVYCPAGPSFIDYYCPECSHG